MCLNEVNFSCTASVYKHSYVIEPRNADRLLDLGPALVVVRVNYTKIVDIPSNLDPRITISTIFTFHYPSQRSNNLIEIGEIDVRRHSSSVVLANYRVVKRTRRM